MGVINSAWFDTVAEYSGLFGKSMRDAGWPEAMTPGELAALMRSPICRDDLDGLAVHRSRADFIATQCTLGAIEHATKVSPQKTLTLITAPAFAAWLAAQGEAPSVHIQAWFEAVGVAKWVPATNTTTPSPPAQDRKPKRRDLLAPLIEAAQKACEDPRDAAAVFTSLRTWAQSKPPRAPLVGVTNDGRIQWSDSNDTPQELNSKALAKRLMRQRNAASKPTSRHQPKRAK